MLFMIFVFRGLASLRVREHKVLGPYVEGLTKLVVSSFAVSTFSSQSFNPDNSFLLK